MTSSRPQSTAHLLHNTIQGDELDQNYLNEAKIHELDKQLVTYWMQAYYAWIMIYIAFTTGSAIGHTKVVDGKSIILTYSMYLKALVDVLTVLGCVMLFVGFCRKSAGIVEKVIMIFKINLISTVAFYLIAVIFGSGKLHLVWVGLGFGAVAFLNILPVIYIKNILKKREAIYPYSSLVDDSLI